MQDPTNTDQPILYQDVQAQPGGLERYAAAVSGAYMQPQQEQPGALQRAAQIAFSASPVGSSDPLPIFSPDGPPILGENSSTQAGFLQDGEFEILENLVPDDKVATVRYGSSAAFAGSGSTATIGNAEFRTWANMIAYYGSGGRSSPVYRGSCYDPKTGILYVAIGYTEGGSGYTDIVWYSPTNSRWTWKTRSSGASDYYGNTRFSGNSEMVIMELVDEKHWFDTDAFAGSYEYSYLVAIYPDGKQWPRVAPSIDDNTLYEFAIHQPIKAPDYNACWTQARFGRWFALNSSETTWTNTGAKLAASVVSTENYVTISVGAGGVVGSDYITINTSAVSAVPSMPTRPSVAQSGQTLAWNPWGVYTGAGVDTTDMLMRFLVISVSDENMPAAYDLWRNIRIRACTASPSYSAVSTNPASAWVTIFDGAYVNQNDANGDSYPEPIRIKYSDGSNRYLIAFALPRHKLVDANYQYLAITQSVSGAPPATDGTFNIECMALTSGLPGFTTFGVTYFNSQSRAESPLTVCRKSLPARLDEMGGRTGSIRIPESDGLVYNHRIYSPQMDPANAPTGTEYVLTYSKPLKGQWGMLSGDHQRSQVYSAGSWSYATGNSGNNQPDIDASSPGKQRIRHVTVEFQVPRVPPTALNVGIPPGTSMANANQRLCIGGARLFRSSATISSPLADSSSSGYSVAFSRSACPFHFDPFVQLLPDGTVDPSSPTVAYITGGNVTAVHKFSTGDIGGDSVIAFSPFGMHIIAGNDAYQLSKATKVGDVGCTSHYSVASNSRSVYWLDDQGQIRAYGEENGVLSRNTVDNQLKGIPANRRKYVTAAMYNDKYIFGFTEYGQTENTRALVYDTIRQAWSGWRSAAYAYGGLLAVFDSGERKLLNVDTNCEGIFRLDDKSTTTDAGSDITVTLKSKEVHAGYIRRVKGEDVTVLATGNASKTLSITWTSLGVSTPVSKTQSRVVDAGSSLAWVSTRSGTQQVPGYQITVSGAMASGEKIYAVWVQNSVHEANQRGE